MNLLYGASGEVVGAEMTPAEFSWRSSSSKSVIDGIPHVTVWCVVGQRSEVPVRFSAPVEVVPEPAPAAVPLAA